MSVFPNKFDFQTLSFFINTTDSNTVLSRMIGICSVRVNKIFYVNQRKSFKHVTFPWFIEKTLTYIPKVSNYESLL